MNRGRKKQEKGVIESLMLFVRDSIKQISDFLHLAALEAKLALKTLMLMAVLVFILSSVLTALWISVLAALFFGLLSLHFGLFTSSLLIVCVNLAALSAIFYLFAKMKPNLYFQGTVSQCTYSDKHVMDVAHERITTEN
jgi:hypothetical protein